MINEHKRQRFQHWKVRFGEALSTTIFYANELDWTQFTSAPIFLEKGLPVGAYHKSDVYCSEESSAH